MSEQFNPPTPPQSNNNKNITPKHLFSSVFFILAFAFLLVVIFAPSDNSSTTDTTAAPAPVVTSPPAPPVNKYDAYLEHVYNNSGQANSMTKAKLIEYGDIICNALDNGRSVEWIAEYLSQNSSGQSDIDLYASIMFGAIKNICPEHDPALQAYLNS